MAVGQSFQTSRGTLTYKPLVPEPSHPPPLTTRPRPRCSRIVTTDFGSATGALAATHDQLSKPGDRLKERLATTRDDTFRRLRSIIASSSTTGPKDEVAQASQIRRGSVQRGRSNTQEMPGPDFLRSGARTGSSQRTSVSNGNGVQQSPTRSRAGSLADTKAQTVEERPVAAGNGVSISINLAEPVLFLQGFEPGDAVQRSTAMLRGTLNLRIAKSAKIKSVSLRFKGTACTKWPEGKQIESISAYPAKSSGRHTTEEAGF